MLPVPQAYLPDLTDAPVAEWANPQSHAPESYEMPTYKSKGRGLNLPWDIQEA